MNEHGGRAALGVASIGVLNWLLAAGGVDSSSGGRVDGRH